MIPSPDAEEPLPHNAKICDVLTQFRSSGVYIVKALPHWNIPSAAQPFQSLLTFYRSLNSTPTKFLCSIFTLVQYSFYHPIGSPSWFGYCLPNGDQSCRAEGCGTVLVDRNASRRRCSSWHQSGRCGKANQLQLVLSPIMARMRSASESIWPSCFTRHRSRIPCVDCTCCEFLLPPSAAHLVQEELTGL